MVFDLAYTFTAGRRGTTLRNLAVDTEPGARVIAACRTKRNKRCTRTKDLARSAASVRLKGFEGKRLPVGATLTMRVTKDRMIGVVKTLTIRKGKSPSLKTQKPSCRIKVTHGPSDRPSARPARRSGRSGGRPRRVNSLAKARWSSIGTRIQPR